VRPDIANPRSIPCFDILFAEVGNNDPLPAVVLNVPDREHSLAFLQTSARLFPYGNFHLTHSLKAV
jgi:hypothetical protein